MIIRKATEEDLVQLMDIYNEAILHTTATFDTEEKDIKNRQNWFYEHRGRYGLLVAVDGRKVLGYAALSPYRSRTAYEETCELELYVRKENQGEGIGTALLERMVDYGRQQAKLHTIVSVITSENEGSIHIHQREGFTHCGTIRDAGRKFGRYLNADIYQLMLHT